MYFTVNKCLFYLIIHEFDLSHRHTNIIHIYIIVYNYVYKYVHVCISIIMATFTMVHIFLPPGLMMVYIFQYLHALPQLI